MTEMTINELVAMSQDCDSSDGIAIKQLSLPEYYLIVK